MGRPHSLSTPIGLGFCPVLLAAIPVFKPFFTGPDRGLGAALEPHSSDVLAAVGKRQDVRGEPVQRRN